MPSLAFGFTRARPLLSESDWRPTWRLERWTIHVVRTSWYVVNIQSTWKSVCLFKPTQTSPLSLYLKRKEMIGSQINCTHFCHSPYKSAPLVDGCNYKRSVWVLDRFPGWSNSIVFPYSRWPRPHHVAQSLHSRSFWQVPPDVEDATEEWVFFSRSPIPGPRLLGK